MVNTESSWRRGFRGGRENEKWRARGEVVGSRAEGGGGRGAEGVVTLKKEGV